jgi:hypothetical protein
LIEIGVWNGSDWVNGFGSVQSGARVGWHTKVGLHAGQFSGRWVLEGLGPCLEDWAYILALGFTNWAPNRPVDWIIFWTVVWAFTKFLIALCNGLGRV